MKIITISASAIFLSIITGTVFAESTDYDSQLSGTYIKADQD